MGGIAQLISTMATTLLFLHLGFGLVGIAIASFLGTGIMLFLYLFFLYHDPKYELSIRYGLASMRTLREILPYSLRSFVLGITSQVLYFTDNILIGLFLGASDVTSFFIAFRVTFLVTYIFSVISTTLFPRFSNLYALRKIEELRELFLRTTKISVAIMTSLAICLFLYGQPFITLWVGNENFIGMSVLSALIIMDFFHASGTTPGLLLQGIGKNRIFVYSEVTNSVLKLLLSVVLVREQGVLGVVVGTLLGHILTSCWAVPWLACRYTSLSILRYLKAGILPPLIAGVPVLCLALLLRDYLLPPDSYIRIGLDSFFLILAYGGSYLALGLAKEERKTYFNFVLRRYSALVQR
jgi:O-antigen/teichoic acid export membrane protein